MINKADLKPGYMIFGNKGNVWSNTAHIYKSGTGNLCGTPDKGLFSCDFKR